MIYSVGPSYESRLYLRLGGAKLLLGEWEGGGVSRVRDFMSERSVPIELFSSRGSEEHYLSLIENGVYYAGRRIVKKPGKISDLEDLVERVEPGDIVYLQGVYLLFFPDRVNYFSDVLRRISEKGAFIFSDGLREPGLFWKYVDVVSLNEREYRQFRKNVHGYKGIVIKRMGIRGAALIFPNGKVVYSKKPAEFEPILPVHLGDTYLLFSHIRRRLCGGAQQSG